MAVFLDGRRIERVGLDADDTLWHNETLYQETQRELVTLLEVHGSADRIREHLLSVEQRNLARYGYGIKSFVLSMIEAALDLAEGALDPNTIERILALGKRMLSADVVLLPGVRETVERLARHVPLWLITKGDLRDQHDKLDRSGLKDLFEHVDVVAEKTRETYARILNERATVPETFLMVGNSPRSDIEPVLALGGQAVQIPYHVLWEHENSRSNHEGAPPWPVVQGLSELLTLLGLESEGGH